MVYLTICFTYNYITGIDELELGENKTNFNFDLKQKKNLDNTRSLAHTENL